MGEQRWIITICHYCQRVWPHHSYDCPWHGPVLPAPGVMEHVEVVPASDRDNAVREAEQLREARDEAYEGLWPDHLTDQVLKCREALERIDRAIVRLRQANLAGVVHASQHRDAGRVEDAWSALVRARPDLSPTELTDDKEG